MLMHRCGIHWNNSARNCSSSKKKAKAPTRIVDNTISSWSWGHFKKHSNRKHEINSVNVMSSSSQFLSLSLCGMKILLLLALSHWRWAKNHFNYFKRLSHIEHHNYIYNHNHFRKFPHLLALLLLFVPIVYSFCDFFFFLVFISADLAGLLCIRKSGEKGRRRCVLTYVENVFLVAVL